MALPFTIAVPDVDFVLSFVFVLGLGIMFFGMQHTLKRRKVFIRKFIASADTPRLDAGSIEGFIYPFHSICWLHGWRF